jgi:hypothetical protein
LPETGFLERVRYIGLATYFMAIGETSGAAASLVFYIKPALAPLSESYRQSGLWNLKHFEDYLEGKRLNTNELSTFISGELAVESRLNLKQLYRLSFIG